MDRTYSATLLAYSISFLICISFSSNSVAKTNQVEFVAEVPKKCKHIGSLRTTIENKKVFGVREKGQPRGIHTWIRNGHEVFTAILKKRAAAKGADRLVIKDIDYDMDIIHHRGIPFYKIKRTHIRARAFRCRK